MDYEPLPDSDLDRVRLLEGILISAATTGGNPTDNHTYTELRTAFMQDHALNGVLPSFIRICRDLSHFRAHTQSVDPQWAPRRKYIRHELTPMFDHFEGANRQPVDAVTTGVLQKFDAEGIAAVWQKALDRRHKDPEGAITAARTLLETVCKHILDEGSLDYEGDDLPALYAKTATLLNIAPSQHTEQAFKRILGGATSVIEGLGSLRNKIGDAHGQGKRAVKPSARHAQLAVNLAGTMATFLIETWLTRIPDD
jgi:hypothetical protein